MATGTIVLVHGGVSGAAGAVPVALDRAVAAGTSEAAHLDAVEAAVRVLEDDPRLNAGTGSVLNSAGQIELDAGIADGTTGACGGVAGVRVRYPISLARKVLEETPHVLLAGEGAHQIAGDMELLERSSDEQHERWERARASGLPRSFGAPEDIDTVGAVALDAAGRLAAGSSTGGVFGKMPGRVGDAPIFGAGIYASARVAVVGTGLGERFLEGLACARVGSAVEAGATAQAACEEVVRLLGGIPAGLLALTADGDVGAAFHGGGWSVWGPQGVIDAAQV